MTRLLTISAFAFLCSSVASGQEDTVPQKTRLPAHRNAQVSVPDAGFVRHRSRTRSSYEILAASLPPNMANTICSKTVANGKTTYDIIHDSKPLGITIGEDGRIEVRRIRRYTRNNIDQLKSDLPELARHVAAIPRKIDGKSIVNFSLDIEITVTAKNADELQASRPDVHAIFVRYTTRPVVTQSKVLKVIEESE